MDLKTLEDYQKAARSWVEHVIPSDATFIKKLCCISTQSLNVFRDLLWLTRKEPLKPDFDEGYLACPVDLWRPVLNEYYPHDLWLYSVLRAVKIISFWKPIFDNAGSDLESSHQNDLGLYEIWPKMTDATTAFNGAGFSTAEAIINGLWRFLLNTVECFCSRDRDMPDIFLVSENVMGYRNDLKNMEIWPNQHPAIKLWKDATLKEAKEYFPSAKWPLADLDGEYSRVSTLLDHEVTLALEKRPERDSGSKVGGTEHSLPLFMKQWAYIFGVSANKMRELRKGNQYHFREVSPRKWTLPKGELPAEYLEKFRSVIPKSQPKKE